MAVSASTAVMISIALAGRIKINTRVLARRKRQPAHATVREVLQFAFCLKEEKQSNQRPASSSNGTSLQQFAAVAIKRHLKKLIRRYQADISSFSSLIRLVRFEQRAECDP
jgi:hypothetical protein